MPLNDIDLKRRRSAVGFPIDQVDFIVYSYNEQIFEERHFQSVHELFNLLENETENNRSYWIEVINRSSVELPNSIQLLCEYFDIHPLTIEDITTLTTQMKLDLFYDQPAIYHLMKIISWKDQRIEQQQISFYLKCSQNVLITFQEGSTDDQSCFDSIRNRLRYDEQQSSYLKKMTIDYLFYCLFNAIIDRYMHVIEEIARRIDQFDEKLMTDKQSLTIETFHSIYRLKHDILHLRILFNPLREINQHLQRTVHDERFLFYRPSTSDSLSNTTMSLKKRPRRFINESIYIYLNDVIIMNHLIDSLNLHHENVSSLISFWLTLNSMEMQKTLEFLMLISALFMPTLCLCGVYSTNFEIHPEYEYFYGRYIIIIVLAAIIIGMIIWYKLKRWIKIKTN